jgi:hypothetical protein
MAEQRVRRWYKVIGRAVVVVLVVRLLPGGLQDLSALV